VFPIPFDMLADWRGEHWRLTPKQGGDLSLAVCRVVVKYLPGFLMKYKEEFALIFVSAAIIGPRIVKDRELAAERQAGIGTVRGDGDPGERENDVSQAAGRNRLAG
jgi:hypothetical protein